MIKLLYHLIYIILTLHNIMLVVNTYRVYHVLGTHM